MVYVPGQLSTSDLHHLCTHHCLQTANSSLHSISIWAVVKSSRATGAGSISVGSCACMISDMLPLPKQKKNPLWKVQLYLDELNAQAQKMWVTGKYVSIDEQTLGFKGRHGLKLRISYKKEGD